MYDVERDHVDHFVDDLRDVPGLELDFEVEAIVDRIQGLNKRLKDELEETLATHDLTWGEWRVLGKLACHGEPFRKKAGELAEELELSTGAMTNRLDRLEQAGLIERLGGVMDRRVVWAQLTTKGHKAWAATTNTQARKEARIASALSKREQKQLNGLLRNLMLSFERSEAPAAKASKAPASPAARR